MAIIAKPLLFTTLQQWRHYSYSNTIIIPSFPRLHSSSRVFVLNAVRARDFNFDPRTWFEDEDEDEMEFLRRRRKRRRRIRSGSKRVKEKQWWFGSNQVEGEEVSGIVDQIVDNLWILRVFKSYGWFLPIILISFVLAVGPKAFLMGSGVPFGLSLLAFAFDKLSEWLDSRTIPSPNPVSKRKSSRFSGRQDVTMVDGANQMRESRKSVGHGVNNFGGWDELFTEDEIKRAQRPSTTEARLKMMTERTRRSSTKRRDLPY